MKRPIDSPDHGGGGPSCARHVYQRAWADPRTRARTNMGATKETVVGQTSNHHRQRSKVPGYLVVPSCGLVIPQPQLCQL
ncbi:MAG: hypothetical protein ACKVJD_08355, partial [Burkholderiales bacterium]